LPNGCRASCAPLEVFHRTADATPMTAILH
jgi:hypothetical protein